MNGALSEVAMQFKVPRVVRTSRDKCVAAQSNRRRSKSGTIA